tara:strand:+ start:790 stop:1014 length:225 start_codon:yes stop_codon:yes gene_type:complete
MQEKVSDIFETADLGTAAFLVTMGCRLLSAGTDRSRYSFVFEGQERCRELAVQYISSEFSKFDSALKNLRNLVK